MKQFSHIIFLLTLPCSVENIASRSIENCADDFTFLTRLQESDTRIQERYLNKKTNLSEIFVVMSLPACDGGAYGTAQKWRRISFEIPKI